VLNLLRNSLAKHFYQSISCNEEIIAFLSDKAKDWVSKENNERQPKNSFERRR
jgi:hypothetical protein